MSLAYGIGLLVDLAELLLFLFAVYYFGISAFSLFSPRRAAQPQQEVGEPYHRRFAVVIPAHNEEAVIGAAIDSIFASAYPRDRFAVYVMADHCTDTTEQIARQHGAVVLYPSGPSRGKGAALADAFAQLSASDAYDCIAVMDADNVADPRFLSEINDCFEGGARIVQGYIDSKNPNAGWLANAYSIWYWIENRLASLARSRLGLGVLLRGTGFAADIELLRALPFPTQGLAEDAEYTLMLSLQDISAAWAHKAVVYDEKPTQMRVSIRQRIRWMQGIADAEGRYTGHLLRSRKFHMLLALWQDTLCPVCVCLFTVLYILATCSLCRLHTFQVAELWTAPFNYVLLSIYVWGNLLLTAAALIIDKKLSRTVICNVFGFLLYIISWIPIGVIGLLRHTKKDWYHTEHTGSGVMKERR